MNIERDEQIQFHEQGTLNAVTRWIANHDEGIAEWLKNVRRAYQPDRANVAEEHRCAVLLLRDATESRNARIGLLDVGGADLDDITAWSTWQDPEASTRMEGVAEEATQGNGGKAYMFRLFRGVGRVLGVRAGRRNCKGFLGDQLSVERGTPGFIPDVAQGREVAVDSVLSELKKALKPYGIDSFDLPEKVRTAIEERQAFTLVEASGPTGLLYQKKIDAEDLIMKALRHDQSALALQQLEVFAIHQRVLMNDGKSLELPAIEPFPDVEGPFVCPIPEMLQLPDGGEISTTDGDQHSTGRLTLHTSKEDMYRGYKNLRPRWKISYWAATHDNIGSKPVSDFTAGTPGAQHVYGEIELPALDPGYVAHGRQRPKPGPLMEALDHFVTEKIREVAKLINDRKKRDLDDRALDEVQRENQMLDQFKNKFLPQAGGSGGHVGDEGDGGGNGGTRDIKFGTVPSVIEMQVPEEGLVLGCGVGVHLKPALIAKVLDEDEKPVREKITWHSSDPNILRIEQGDYAVARNKGTARVWCSVRAGRRQTLESDRVDVSVWLIDHVLLTPRKVEIAEGGREVVVAEVTNDQGDRSTDVYLRWKHDADDPLTVLIGPRGVVTGNRPGRTSVTAGAPGPSGEDLEVWARIPVDVQVVTNPEEGKRGGGFPKLLLTGRDVDPATGLVRDGDPASPALWQESADFVNNLWWLNVQSPEAFFAFSLRDNNPEVWRNYHSLIVTEMVVQVHMQAEYSRKEEERPAYWAEHKYSSEFFRVTTVQDMWRELEGYVREGKELP